MSTLDAAGAKGTRLPQEREGFGRLYCETFDTVYRYASTLTSNATEAEDIAAEVFIRAWQSRARFRGEGSVLSWLLSITHNCAQTAIRKRGRESVDLDLVAGRADPAVDPGTALCARAFGMELQFAIRELTPSQQQVIFLRFVEGLSTEAIARRLGRGPDAVRALQSRAIKSLRVRLPAKRPRQPVGGRR
ncbi:MAG: sigma-70 family RNA polymerase sigma factor [Dehalococcoidia bacterium]